MNVELPVILRMALEGRILEKYPVSALTAAAEAVSARYRREGNKGAGFQLASEVEALSYLAARMPATYAANVMALSEVNKRLPDFTPTSVLDLGAGPGTSSVAVCHQFESIESVHLVEPNYHLKKAGQDILESHLPSAVWNTGKVEDFKVTESYDVVMASYVFNEIDPNKLGQLITKYWDACSGVMVILEPGTPQGAGIIQVIRNWAIAKNINILAPCPHSNACPLAEVETRWCHFSVRTSRTKLHKILKGGDAGFEDEKFSYIILSRAPSVKPQYRIVGHPSGTKLREMQVCGPKGAETLQVSKSHPLHKLSKKLEWGDSFDL